MTKKSRIYNSIEKISTDNVSEFWNSRAKKTSSLEGVLLGEGLVRNSAVIRNEKEKKILQSLLTKNKKIKILDIGSGIGRWANNLLSIIDVYHGIDFSENFVLKACEIFKNYKNISFFTMSATEIDRTKLLKHYDLILINGVCMYINDVPLLNLFSELNDFLSDQGCIYLQESVSITGNRLTLNEFYSKDLKCTYSAIYRTKNDYDTLIAKQLTSIEILKTGLLLDEKSGAREETNAQYWFLKK